MKDWENFQVFVITHKDLEEEEFLEMVKDPVLIQERERGIPISQLRRVEQAFQGVVKLDTLDPDSLPGVSQKKKNKDVFRSLPFHSGHSKISVGKDRSCHIQLDLPWISDRHALFLPPSEDSSFYSLVDLDSEEGTTLNEANLMPHIEYPLVDFCRIVFGKAIKYIFFTPQGLHTYIQMVKDQ